MKTSEVKARFLALPEDDYQMIGGTYSGNDDDLQDRGATWARIVDSPENLQYVENILNPGTAGRAVETPVRVAAAEPEPAPVERTDAAHILYPNNP